MTTHSRYRGHAWRANIEMAAAMLLPAIVAMGLVWTRVVQGIGVLMVIEHVAMLACMLAAMLLRRDEYSGATHHHATPPHASGAERGGNINDLLAAPHSLA